MKKKQVFSLVFLFFYRIFYFSLLGLLLGIAIQSLIPITGLIGYLAIFILAFLVCIVLHEIGHLIGAAIANLHVTMFSVFFFTFFRIKEHWHFRLNKFFLLGGFTLAFPLDDQKLIRRLLILTAGGPVIGLLYGLASLVTLLVMSPLSIQSNGVLTENQFIIIQVWLLANAVFSFLISLHSLLPDQSWSSTSDGYKLVQYWRKGRDATAIKYLYLLNGAARSGVRPRDWPDEYLDYLADPSEPPSRRMHGLYLKYLSEMDKGMFFQAGRRLDQALLLSRGEQLSGASLYWESAYYTARYRNQPGLARQWMDKAREGFIDEEQTRARAEAAILLAEGHYDRALQWIEKGLEQINWSMEPGTAQAEKDWLEEIRVEAEQFLSSPNSALQVQIEKFKHVHLTASNVSSPTKPLEIVRRKSLSMKGRLFEGLRIENLVQLIFLRVTPMVLFCLILIVLYYWLPPPACHPKLFDNFFCKSRYNRLILQGLEAEQHNLHKDALEAFSEALVVQPQGCLAFSMRARQAASLGDLGQAYHDYSNMLDQCFQQSSLLFSGNETTKKNKIIIQAIDTVIVTVNPEDKTTFFEAKTLLERLFHNLGDIKAYIETLQMDDQGMVMSEKDWCKLGLAYAFQGDSIRAKEIMEQMTKSSVANFEWCLAEIGEISGMQQ